MLRKIVISTTCFFILAACGNPINRHNANNYHQWALEAEWGGDYELAERNYSRALVNAQLGDAPDAGISMITYNLGRMKGLLCKKQEAEQLLLDSLVLEEKVSGPISSNISKRLFEIARLYYDYEEYSSALPYYERGIPMLEGFNFEKDDPIAFSDILSEYGNALTKAGNENDANKNIARAKLVRSNNEGEKADFVPARYNEQCNKSIKGSDTVLKIEPK